LTEGIHRFEGTVNQYTGDGVMALFGAPIAHEDHARRACYAALHLQEELGRYALELRRESGLSFAFRMGINSGDVVVGRIGDDLRMDYTAQGSTVGLAQRMEQLAEANGVYIAPDAARHVQGYFELEDMGEFNVKGAAAALQVYALRGLGRLRTRLQVSQSRGFSKFVGRADEMQTVELALKHALDGHGEVVGVVGEAGVGKSRLCYEFTEACRARDIPVYEAHCPAHGQTIPYLPVFELLRSYFGVTDQDTAEEARKKIAGTLVLLDSTFQESLPLVLEFLGVADPNRPGPNMDPEARQRQLFVFIRQLVQARSEREPAVIFVDDMHWIDTASDAFFAQLIEILDQTRTLLLLNFRPEYDAAWTSKSYYQQLPVVPLGREAIDELMRSLLGEDPTLKDLPTLIHKRTGGNPFFIEEVVQTLDESGTLAGSRGAYRLTTDVGALQIPETVRAILAARIDRLTERSKHVLQTAAVIGKEFIEPILQDVVDVSGTDLGAALQSLQSAEFIYEQTLYPVVEYAFKHPLTQEVALDTQLQERRRLVHGAVARATIAAAPEKLDEHSALIAYHYEAAAEKLEAARWHRRAGEWVGLSDPLGGGRHWRRVLEMARALDADEEIETLHLEACKALLNVESWRLGMDLQEMETLIDEGRVIADRRNDIDSVAVLECSRATRCWTLGEMERFSQVAVEVRKAIPLMRDEDQKLSVLILMAFPAYISGDLKLALEEMDQVEALVREGDFVQGMNTVSFSAHAWHLGLRPLFLAWTGNLEDARKDIETAIQLERDAKVREPLTWAYANRAVIAYLIGTEGAASKEFERAAIEGVQMSREHANGTNICYSLVGLAFAHLQCERFAEVVRAVEEFFEAAEEYDVGGDQKAEGLALKSMAHLGLGEVDDAIASAREAIVEIEATGTEAWRPLASVALVRALVATRDQGHVPEIERVLESGLAGAESCGIHGMTPQLMECRAELAGLTDGDAKREEFLADALARYRSIGATGHVARLESLIS